MKACHACGAEWTEQENPGFSTQCEGCGEYLHCCRNCRFYAPGHHNDCREDQAETVRDGAVRNLCEYFQFTDRDAAGAAPDRSAAARARLEELFGEPKGGAEAGGE